MRTTIILGFVLLLGGCDRNSQTSSEPGESSVTRNTESARPAENMGTERAAANDSAQNNVDADNTKLNERDRGGDTLTPGDQGENESDRNITQHIRQSVIKQDGLSTNADNVKIITNGGVVTLRGTVDSAEEKATVARLAQGAPGVTRVDNQLEVNQK